MTLRDEIARLTPGARRYARALVAAESDERTEIADQIVQEAIVRALRADWSGRHSNLRISLYVTINALNRARLRARANRAPLAEDGGAIARAPAAAPMLGAGVTQALDALACDEREALLLVAVEEFDYAQACEILNIPRPTLVARLARARRAVAERIDPLHAQERRRPTSPHLRIVK